MDYDDDSLKSDNSPSSTHHSRRSHFPDFRSADRRRLFDRLFNDIGSNSKHSDMFETSRQGWPSSHRRAFFDAPDDWNMKGFPPRQSSFASGTHRPSTKSSGYHSGFDDFDIPIRVVRETTPEKAAWQKHKERHNSTGSSAATSSSAGSNDSSGNATHKPRVFHIPIHVEARDSESPTRKSPPRKSPPLPERPNNPSHEQPKSPTQLLRSASFVSEPPRNSPRIASPPSNRAQSVPTETLNRRPSPERKRMSPERSRGISRTQSMSTRPSESARIYNHPMKVETISLSPRNPETVREEIVYHTTPRNPPPSSALDSFTTLPRVRTYTPKEPKISEKKAPQSFSTTAQINLKKSEEPQVASPQPPPQSPPAPAPQSVTVDPPHHVTRIPINVEPKNDEELKTSANIIKEAMNGAAQKIKQDKQNFEKMDETPANDNKPSVTAIPVRWVNDEKPQVQKTEAEIASELALKAALNKIAIVQQCVKELKEEIEKFNGTIYDKHYLFLDEQLTQNMLKLDVIPTEGRDEVRKARKATVQEIQACLSILENRVRKSIPVTEPKKDDPEVEQEEGYCSMETDQNATTTIEVPAPMECDTPEQSAPVASPEVVDDVNGEQTKL